MTTYLDGYEDRLEILGNTRNSLGCTFPAPLGTVPQYNERQRRSEETNPADNHEQPSRAHGAIHDLHDGHFGRREKAAGEVELMSAIHVQTSSRMQ